MDRQLAQDFDLYNSEDCSFPIRNVHVNLLTDMPGNEDDAYFNSGLENTYPDFLAPYLQANEKFEIVKPSSLLPGSNAPSEEKKCSNPDDPSCLIAKQMKQEGFGEDNSNENNSAIDKIDPEIFKAMQKASVTTARIKSSDRLEDKIGKPTLNFVGKKEPQNLQTLKKRKLDTRDKFKLV